MMIEGILRLKRGGECGEGPAYSVMGVIEMRIDNHMNK
jgi:hypothetical protein